MAREWYDKLHDEIQRMLDRLAVALLLIYQLFSHLKFTDLTKWLHDGKQ